MLKPREWIRPCCDMIKRRLRTDHYNLYDKGKNKKGALGLGKSRKKSVKKDTVSYAARYVVPQYISTGVGSG